MTPPVRNEPWLAPLLAACGILVLLGGPVHKGWNMFKSPPEQEIILQGADDSGYFYWLRSWVVDRDVDFANDIDITPSLAPAAKRDILGRERTATGRVPNKYFCGWAVLNLPFYVMAHALAFILPGVEANGVAPLYFVFIWAGQLLYAIAGLAIALHVVRRFFGFPVALAAVGLTWLASPLIYYQGARVSMAHNLVFFLVALVTWLTFRIHDDARQSPAHGRARTWILLGLFSGLLVITRPSATLYLLFPAFMVLRLQLRSQPPSGRKMKLFLAGFAAGTAAVSIQLVAWKALYGSFLVWSYTGEGFHFDSPAILKSLFSDYHGLYNWHPFLFVGTVGLVLAAVGPAGPPRSWLLVFALVVFINASWSMWHFGSSFGGRAYEGVVLYCMVGFAWILQHSRRFPWAPRAWIALGLTAGAWNILFLILFMRQLVEREAPVSWPERLAAAARLFGLS